MNEDTVLKKKTTSKCHSS